MGIIFNIDNHRRLIPIGYIDDDKEPEYLVEISGNTKDDEDISESDLERIQEKIAFFFENSLKKDLKIFNITDMNIYIEKVN